jgi:hypothetical protein
MNARVLKFHVGARRGDTPTPSFVGRITGQIKGQWHRRWECLHEHLTKAEAATCAREAWDTLLAHTKGAQ